MEQINDSRHHQDQENPPDRDEDLRGNEECATIVEEDEGGDDVSMVTSQSIEKIEDVVEGVREKDDVIKSWLQSSAE